MTSTTAQDPVPAGNSPLLDPEPPPSPPTPGVAAPRRPNFIRRFGNWFWRGAQLAELKSGHRFASAEVVEWNRRAHQALELGRVAIDPGRPREFGALDAQACDLFKQAVYWGLLAHRGIAGRAAAERDLDRGNFEELWRTADPELLARAAGDAEQAERIGTQLAGKTFLEFAALPSDEQARLARSLQIFAEYLCSGIDSAELAIERLWIGRGLRIAFGLSVLVAIVGGVLLAQQRWVEQRDLLRGRPWTASSRFPEGGCISPSQVCDGSPYYFVCTAEDAEPWVEFDLGAVRSVSALRVDNRTDCCTERAVPLVASVSTDHVHWKEVARSSKEFRTWKASFGPTQARWFKLHIPRQAYLHLSRVRLFD